MKENWANDGALQSFRDAYNDLDNAYAVFPKICGLSDAEYWALVMIQEGLTTQHDISQRLSLSRQTVNSAFSQLVKKNLVLLEPIENNLRTKRVTLTETGSAFVAQYVESMHSLEENVWNMMLPEERTQFIDLISKYRDFMREALQQYQKTT